MDAKTPANAVKFYVIIPIYNVENYVGECLESLLTQSHKNFSAILVDDGSSDKSADIAKSYANKDSRFIFLFQTNMGVSSARNTALNYVFSNILNSGGQQQYKQHYIAFLDSDDFLESNALAHIAEFVSENQVGVFVSNRFFEVGDIANTTKNATKSDKKRICDYTIFNKSLQNHHLTTKELIALYPSAEITTLCAFIFRADIIKNVRFEVGVPNGEDNIFCTLATLESSDIYIDSMPIYNYRVRFGSATRGNNHIAYANSHFRIAEIFEAQMAIQSDEIYKIFYQNSTKRAVKHTLEHLQFCGYSNALNFSKKDLARFLPLIKGKRRFCYYFPKIYGIPKRVRKGIVALFKR